MAGPRVPDVSVSEVRVSEPGAGVFRRPGSEQSERGHRAAERRRGIVSGSSGRTVSVLFRCCDIDIVRYLLPFYLKTF